jgi:MFS family permease
MDSRTDRRNGLLFFWATMLIYLAAPVIYVGVTQAALCDKLGASATVASLPASGFFVGSFAPIFFACFIPHRWDRLLVVVAFSLMALLLAVVAVSLFLPMSDQIRIAAVVSQSLILGFLNSVSQVYMYQCLGRATTEAGRSWTLKLTFTIGPLAAVAGSLLAQFVLRGGIPGVSFPRDFGILYLIGVPCMAGTAWCCGRLELAGMKDEALPPFFSSLWNSFRRYLRSRDMVFLFLAYLLWNCTLQAMPNLSLFTHKALGREPAEFSGVILALRFGCKAMAGYALGVLNMRYGLRAPLIATVSMLGLAMVWAWVVPGYLYLAAFGLMGAGELGGAYFPNVLLTWSSPADATRDMSILNLAVPLGGPAATVHGMLTDHWGFSASFIFGIATAAAALALVLKLPKRKSPPAAAG